MIAEVIRIKVQEALVSDHSKPATRGEIKRFKIGLYLGVKQPWSAS